MKLFLQLLAFLFNLFPKTEFVLLHWCEIYNKYGLKVPNLVGKVNAPTCSTQAATYTSYDSTAITGNGTVVSTGGENPTRGICYMTGTSGDPTIANSTANVGTGGVGAYAVPLTGLSPNTAYRVRAYVTNSAGTGYGTTVQAYTPPTTALNTPADTAINISTTPDLLFTGTSGGQELEYNIQIDTQNTFDSNLLYYFNASNNSNTAEDPNSVFTNDANFVDSSSSAPDAISSTAGSSSSNYLQANGSNAPTTGVAITKVEVSLVSTQYGGVPDANGGYAVATSTAFTEVLATASVSEPSGGPSNSAWVELTVPTGGWTWQKIHDLVCRVWRNTTGTMPFGQLQIRVNGKTTNLLSKFSVTPDATFSGIGDPHPWPSGNQITYTVQAGDALAANTIYYWRVSATDPSGSNTYGAWATTRSFTTASGVSAIPNKIVQILQSIKRAAIF